MSDRLCILLLTAAAAASAAAGAWATVVLSVDEALALAFPEAAIRRETMFLDDGQRREVERLSGAAVDSALVTRFVATGEGGRVVGHAYLDTHRVRTLPETVMVVVGVDGRVARVEVVVFREPMEYKPGDAWYRQYDGEALGDDLALKKNIRPVTGATLTARATTDAVRRVLAIHRVAVQGNAP